MIDSYKYVNGGNIVAYDTSNGLIEYDYQDNIHELLEQENVVEELGNIIKKLYNERNYLKDHKKDFHDMFFNDKYKFPILFLFGLSVLIVAIGSGYGINPLVFNILRGLLGISLFSLVLTIIHSQKNIKKDNEMKLLSLEQQITEFEKKFEVELKKLNKLRSDTKAENYHKNITNVVVSIDNKKIKTISNITRKKQLYEFYRKYLGSLKRYNNKEYLNHLYKTDFTDEDVGFVNEMDKTNKDKVLSKKKE